MFIFKDKYYLIIQNTKDINLNSIKKRDKFSIILRNNQIIKDKNLLKFKFDCKKKGINFYIANNISLALSIKSDGLYISAYNKDLRFLRYLSKKFKLIGSAHNLKEANIKRKQGCTTIFLSRLFKTNYKYKKGFLGIVKFNLIKTNLNCNISPLGGIRTSNIVKLKGVKSRSFAILSEIKKKPAIISRLF